MVLGETEIFGQVKKAYAIAQETGTTARRMNKLFQQSFSVGKLVRSNSSIQQGSTSIGSAAVDLAEKIFGKLDGCRVMIIGAGEMSRTTAQSLLSRGARSIIVSNRSYDKAVELAAELKARRSASTTGRRSSTTSTSSSPPPPRPTPSSTLP